ncbi:MAG: hypothetical protein JWN65_2642 [Solirubrobacterales bacterium]|nr:hypothetical protein [Solirubrobacterales bacterium]
MRRVLAAAVLATLVAGCGSKSAPDPIDAYVVAANAVQSTAAPRFAAANDAYRQFAKGTLKGTKAAFALRQAELQIEAARQRLAQLHPPPAARRLHALLLRTYELNVLLAAETRQMAAYTPRAQLELRRVDAIRKALQRKLSSAGGPGQQVSALRSYAAAIARAQDRLSRANPPPVLVAGREAQLQLLGRSRPAALALARAIERRDSPAVSRLMVRFKASGTPIRGTAALTRGALAAYRQRVTEIDRSGSRAQTELARLLRKR